MGRIVLAAKPRKYRKKPDVLRLRPILNQPSGEAGFAVSTWGKAELLPEFSKKLGGI